MSDSAALDALLREIEELLRRFVVLPSEHAITALALFVAHTWTIEAAHATPYLIVSSPEKQSGKSRLIEVLSFAVRHPEKTASASEAALFQLIESERPTLLLDETDAIFTSSRNDGSEALRKIINAGNRPGSQAIRGTKEGDAVRRYSTFCPKVLAGIDTGKLPDTIQDRGIVIRMQRRQPHEQVERFREAKVEGETEHLRIALNEWAEGAVEILRDAEPELPEELPDRAADSWEPLLAIADLAGTDWPARSREAAGALSVPTEGQELGVGAQLLAAVRRAFGAAAKVTSRDLVARVNGDPEAPFGAWRDGQGLDERTLARLLTPYGVKPKAVRFGLGAKDVARGYAAADLHETFARYLPPLQHNTSATETLHEHKDVMDVIDVMAPTGVRADGEQEGLAGARAQIAITSVTATTDCPF